MKTTIPYEWKLDLEKNRTGANIHDSRSLELVLGTWFEFFERNKKKNDEEQMEYCRAKVNKTLKKGFEKGYFSYKHEL